MRIWLRAVCSWRVNATIRSKPARKIIEVWEEERAALRAMPAPFDGYAEDTARISQTCLVNFERNRYSVDCRYAGRVATVRAYAERIVLMCGEEMIGEHPRFFGRGHVQYNPWHYVPALERKPGALRNGAPFKDWNLPAAMTRLRERLARHPDGDRQFVEVLSMVALYGLDAVSEACAVALDEQVASSAHVVNLLHRAAAPAPVAPLQVPDALKLTARAGRQLRSLRPAAALPHHRCPHPSLTRGESCKPNN